jgi:DNA helicase II / ATP-dependent DNA helicase PcrA
LPLSPNDIATAEHLQQGAAHDASSAIRLVAGPGTGKSATIEERFRWLYSDINVHPRRVFGVSFTRAAATDLKLRVNRYCEKHKVAVGAKEIRLSTLHSLALTTLQKANLLIAYPVRPLVIDDWEVENIFDAEFVEVSGYQPSRAREIRRAREAFWSTGHWNPANYIQPVPPITQAEHNSFQAFHGPTTQTYACVLPGEIVRRCVEQVQAHLLSPAELLEMEHLIVDEYQDLNPMDLEFVDQLRAEGVQVFVAGDDDQSIYSFRFASPAGIQDFPQRHPGAGDHVLEGCFRCATEVVRAANDLIENNSPNARIPKEALSLWETANPPVEGIVHRWRFVSHIAEANAIARSCRALLNAGLPASEIMVLISNRRLFDRIKQSFDAENVPFVPPKEKTWRDTEAGRFMLAMLRVVTADDDYVALRLVLGCRRGIGPRRCSQIVQQVVANNLRYHDLFYLPLPPGVFNGAQTTALGHARAVCEALAAFTGLDTLDQRGAQLRDLLIAARSAVEATAWDELIDPLPAGTTLEELQEYLWADNSEQQLTILLAIHKRLGLPPPEVIPEPGVRVMTMHGAKGLQAKIVFIPGLEEQVLPGPRRAQAPGLVLEGARLLYVSLTRAQAGAVLSFSTRRFWSGASVVHAPSRYCLHLGGPFTPRTAELNNIEVGDLMQTVAAMAPPPAP